MSGSAQQSDDQNSAPDDMSNGAVNDFGDPNAPDGGGNVGNESGGGEHAGSNAGG